MFQFLIGNVKTNLPPDAREYINLFQFLIGNVKTSVNELGVKGHARFNSS